MSTSDAISDPLESIAIIGLAGRFPGAKNVEQFWQNLTEGRCSIIQLSDAELLAAGVQKEYLQADKYVKSAAVLEDIELFDAEFFGYSAKEAELIDPQHRIFLECIWGTFQNAGYNPENYAGRVGIFGGSSFNTYFFNQIYPHLNKRQAMGELTMLLHANSPDYLCTRASYKLNLKGPSLSIGTACSTSLVAVHLACQSLLTYQCDMALAGGVSIRVPQQEGYFYETGNILSPDGYCRAFDARAAGTVFGSGVGTILLKRLSEALSDRDNIYAIIKGSAVNNDGAVKVGFTAPSVEGQAEVIAEALELAGVAPETICYIEAHGTATQLGDPIEVAALSKVFRAQTAKKQFCALGSVKTNVGHLNAAAGITGLIKAALSLKHRMIPPSLHFSVANPEIDFANSPFYVNTELKVLPKDQVPLRAGVSAFGIGGTNAHVVLEEAPKTASDSPTRPYQLLLFSARNIEALDKNTVEIGDCLTQQKNEHLADIAYTLQTGRKAFPVRRMLVCSSAQEAALKLTQLNSSELFTDQARLSPKIVMMFPGQGSQYVGMAEGLYKHEAAFRQCVDECANLLKKYLATDLREVLFNTTDSDQAEEKLVQTAITQPALFVCEYALARLWQHWGVVPQAFIGHSVGEYVSACLAGVFDVEDALKVVAIRGRLVQSLPAGSMIVVFLSPEQVAPYLGELTVAAVNAPDVCVVSGETPAVKALEQQLLEAGIRCRRLNTSHAFHSPAVEPILKPFKQLMEKIPLQVPQVPFISNLTGTWIKKEEACDPSYWVAHLRGCVRFAEGIGTLKQNPDWIFIEAGPGNTLSILARKQLGQSSSSVFESLPRQRSSHDLPFLLTTLGRLWLQGVDIKWENFYAGEQRGRFPLPACSLSRKRYWLESSLENQLQTTAENSPVNEQKQFLFSALHQRPHLATPYTAPRNQLEEICVQIWNELLGIDQVGIFDNFFELGGHSLLATQVISRLESSLPIKLSIKEIYEVETVAKLVEVIEQLLAEKLESLSEEEAELLLK